MAVTTTYSEKKAQVTVSNEAIEPLQVEIKRHNNGERSIHINISSGLSFDGLQSFTDKMEKDKTRDEALAGKYIETINDYIQLLTNLRTWVEDETKMSSK